ncbi:MAG: T9SS type A sorting domain-containing protein [Hymenobacteraceae bacterium]|nr:T9SS type A sorting domain-containing protein [Hymenobacteraceae bacterium]
MRFLTRQLAVFGTALSLLASGGAHAQATINVSVSDNRYSPINVTAAPGDNIVFTYNGQSSHPTVSDNAAFATFPMNSSNRTRTITLNAAGVYGYHCQLHGSAGSGMFGTITIQPLGTRAEATPPTSFTTFPNPVSATRDERVTVSFSQRAGTDGKLRLLNVIGRVVRETTVHQAGETGETRLSLDVADLPAGIYFTSLVLGERVVETRRLIVQP